MNLEKYNINYNADLSVAENCKNILKNKPETLAHVLNVADTGVKLAEKFNADIEKVRTACYLHDVCAVVPRSDHINLCREHGLPILPEEEQAPLLIHQKVSEIIARDIFNIKDDEILSAVDCHTTLKVNPSVIDMIVFISDKLSWDRQGTPPFFDILESALEHSLERACLEYINYIFYNNMIIIPHPESVSAKKYLESKIL